MPLDNEMMREFEEVSRTKFWTKYILELQSARNRVVGLLEKEPTISEGVTRGESWQEAIRIIDRIIKLPMKIVGYNGTENPE